ncbi:MAG: hypothetical protein GY851_24590 [bacterium]|nr:hypothetical protein [bacterium]
MKRTLRHSIRWDEGKRLRTLLGLVLTLVMTVTFVAGSAFAAQESPRYPEYLAAIQELGRSASTIAREQGKEALIKQYQAIIDGYPGFSKNIELAATMGQILEWDLSDYGQPADPKGALDAYLNVVETFDPDHPYMVAVKRMAAKRAQTVEPDTAERLYSGLVDDYPDNPALQLESLYGLGQVAGSRGDRASAERHYLQMLEYDAEPLVGDGPQYAAATAHQQNAVTGLLTTAIEGRTSPQARLAAIEALLKRLPVIADRYPEILERFRTAIESQLPDGAKSGLNVSAGEVESSVPGGSDQTSAARPIRERGGRVFDERRGNGTANVEAPGESPPPAASENESGAPSTPVLAVVILVALCVAVFVGVFFMRSRFA